ncbi:MAG TPA: hypothetical protein VGP80_10805 [Gemmatimonadales bacterium]|nr:hypothetical protein [Gemmatimonadales bacterium]
MARYSRQVFLNVPFDRFYRRLFHALVFGVHECGLVARCAQETDDGGQVRLDKLYEIIRQCRFGIHDLSRTTLDATNRLPRFNMPLELGVFLGARRYGGSDQRRKSCLILDRERYRYQIFCSDIAGQDIRSHGNEVDKALAAVRNWLQANRHAARRLPGPGTLIQRYIEFRQQLPFMCRMENLHPAELTFIDYRRIVEAWIGENPRN